MSLDTLIISLGAFVAILPFLGFPISWDHALFFLAGLCIVALGIAARRRLHQKKTQTPEEYHDQASQ